jgi:hypothetical protein
MDKQEPWESIQCTCGGTIYFKHTKKEWVGLTRDEVLDIEETTKHPLGFYQAIEAKLKEKNGG